MCFNIEHIYLFDIFILFETRQINNLEVNAHPEGLCPPYDI